MNVPEGLQVALGYEGELLEPEADDGYVGKLEEGTTLLAVHVLPSREEQYHGFFMDGKKQVRAARDYAREDGVQGKLYKTWISIEWSKSRDVPTTRYPANTFRLVELGEGGAVRIWRIALISQGGEFFIAADISDEARCYRDGENIACPHFTNPDWPRDRAWPEIVGLIAEITASRIHTLQALSRYRQPKQPSVAKLEPNQGIVAWWSNGMGFGAVLTHKGVARAHWENILNGRPRRRYLIPGELVEFESIESPTQTTGRDTSFALEARGVRTITS